MRGTGKETLVSSLIFHIFGIFYSKNFLKDTKMLVMPPLNQLHSPLRAPEV